MHTHADQPRDLAEQSVAAIAALDRYPGRHEFSDTRYRRVSYQVVATTRYGECFPAPPGAAPPMMTRISEPVTVDVLNSANPPPPQVRYVVPAFVWHRPEPPPGEYRSRRRSGILRVYLDRPWYASGDGELLGVLLRANTPTPAGVELSRLTTRRGRDPLWLTAGTSLAPELADFRNAALVREDIPLTGATDPVRLTAVGYEVRFDSTGMCFSDIDVDPGGSYFPFIRLALARFQPRSLSGAELSTVVLADFAQLAPDRAVAAVPDRDGVVLTVSGITHGTAPDPKDSGRTGTWMRAGVQERIPGTEGDDVGWRYTAADLVELTRTGTDDVAVWQGTVDLPASRVPSRFRVLIEEFETYPTADPIAGDPQMYDRLVFAEAIVL